MYSALPNRKIRPPCWCLKSQYIFHVHSIFLKIRQKDMEKKQKIVLVSPQSIQKKPKAEGENKKGMVYFRSIFLYPYNPQRSFSVWFEYPLHQQSRLFPPFKITRKTEKLSKTFWNDCTVLKKT